MANNRMISEIKIPAYNLLYAMDVYTHFKQGEGLKKVDSSGSSVKEPKQNIPYKNEAIAAVNYAETLVNNAPKGKDSVYIDNSRMRDALSDMQLYRRLCVEHCRALTEHGYGMKRSALKKLDSINISSLADYATKDVRTMPMFPVMKTKEYAEYVKENTQDQKLDAVMCMFVPPFTEFSYKLHRDRYMHIKIEEISIENFSMKMTIQDYSVQDTLWIPGTKCSCEVTFYFDTATTKLPNLPETIRSMPLNVPFMRIKLYGECCNPHDINMYVDFKDLNWNQKQIEVWLRNDKDYTQNVMDMIRDQGTSSCLELAKYVLMCNAVTNYMLHGNKPRIVREPKGPKEGKAPNTTDRQSTQADSSPDDQKLPERRIRYIGTVKVTSTAVPRQATPDRVRHYKVAVWKAKGGIRHMKDGRVIPFKESIRYRHKLKDQVTEQQVAQVTLKLHDNSHIACENPDKSV